MSSPSRRTGLDGLRQAFDEVRFGAQNTLNLRDTLPTVVSAEARTEFLVPQRGAARRRRITPIR